MKQISIPLALICMVVFSCQRGDGDSIQTSLDGNWRMIMVKDNISGATITKPSSIQGEVDIIFSSLNSTNGTFVGNTPTNTIAENNFFIGANQALTIPVLSMTKVMETSWGSEFVDNIRNSQSYGFEPDDRLTIRTNLKTLVFQKR